MSHLLIAWTIRLALIFAAIAAVLMSMGWHLPKKEKAQPGGDANCGLPRRIAPQVAKYCWSVGAVIFLGHMFAALHYFHHWSHSHLLDETARRTAETVGVAFGQGVYFSFLFGVVWMADACWWLVWPTSYYDRRGWINAAVYGFLAFIAFNGAVVFETGPTRPIGVVVTVLLLLILSIRLWHQRRREAFAFSDPRDNDQREDRLIEATSPTHQTAFKD